MSIVVPVPDAPLTRLPDLYAHQRPVGTYPWCRTLDTAACDRATAPPAFSFQGQRRDIRTTDGRQWIVDNRKPETSVLSGRRQAALCKIKIEYEIGCAMNMENHIPHWQIFMDQLRVNVRVILQ